MIGGCGVVGVRGQGAEGAEGAGGAGGHHPAMTVSCVRGVGFKLAQSQSGETIPNLSPFPLRYSRFAIIHFHAPLALHLNAFRFLRLP